MTETGTTPTPLTVGHSAGSGGSGLLPVVIFDNDIFFKLAAFTLGIILGWYLANSLSKSEG